MQRSTLNEGIRQRLEQLTTDHSQAELARKAGTVRSKVNRYLKGTRIPADFCAALAAELGVNPAWLITGEGARYLGDVAAGQGPMASDLLTLVESMKNVARMRLGALAGKREQQVLRGLNDALFDYEKLRRQLDEHSRPILAQLLSEIDQHLVSHDDERIPSLFRTAEQVARLCEDEEMRATLLGHKAHFAYNRGDLDEAFAINRRVYQFHLSRTQSFDNELCMETHNFAASLRVADLRPEARRVCESAMALARNLRGGTAPKMLGILSSLLDIELGRARRALPALLWCYAELPEDERLAHTGYVFAGKFITGIATLPQLLKELPSEQGRSSAALLCALGSEQPEDLDAATQVCVGRSRDRLPASQFIAEYAMALHEAIAGKKARSLLEYHKRNMGEVSTMPQRPNRALYLRILATQATRLAGEPDLARVEFMRAEALARELPAQCAINPVFQGLHCRNAFTLARPRDRDGSWLRALKRAHRFVRAGLRGGQRFLLPVAKLQGL